MIGQRALQDAAENRNASEELMPSDRAALTRTGGQRDDDAPGLRAVRRRSATDAQAALGYRQAPQLQAALLDHRSSGDPQRLAGRCGVVGGGERRGAEDVDKNLRPVDNARARRMQVVQLGKAPLQLPLRALHRAGDLLVHVEGAPVDVTRWRRWRPTVIDGPHKSAYERVRRRLLQSGVRRVDVDRDVAGRSPQTEARCDSAPVEHQRPRRKARPSGLHRSGGPGAVMSGCKELPRHGRIPVR